MKEVDLPEGWKTCTLEVIAKFIDYRGRTPKKTSNGIPLITAKNIRDGYINREPREYIAESDYDDWMTRGIPKVGDVLITTEAPMGNVALIDISEKFALAQRAICLQCYEPELGNFLHYALRSPAFQKLLTLNATGTTVNGIKAATLKKLKIPFPSLAEQKVIANKLDIQLVQVEVTKARLELIPNILKTFRQSVLTAAVSGKLTENWRNTPDLIGWENVKLDQIVEKIEAGKNLKCIEVPPQNDEFGIIKISAVTWGRYDEDQSKTLPNNTHFLESRRIAVGDFLISRANTIELLGNPVIVHEVTKNLMLSDKVLRLVMQEENKPWVSIFLRSKRGRMEIESRSTGNQVSMRNIGQKALLDIDLTKPPAKEQAEIVRRVEELFTYADHVEIKATAALERVNNLTQSILAKAFRGELTADWRAANPKLISNDNSAKALLEQIKAKREAIEKQPKPKRSAIKKKKGSHMSKQIMKVVEVLKQAGEPLSGQQLLAAAGYPSDSDTEQLEQFFLDIRDALTIEESIIKLERADDSQDWFALANPPINKAKN